MSNKSNIYNIFYRDGIQEESDGDSSEADVPHGQSRRHHLQVKWPDKSTTSYDMLDLKVI